MEKHQEAFQLINSCTLMRDVDQLLMLKGRILQALQLYASSEQAFLKVMDDQKKLAFEVLMLGSCGFLHLIETVMRILDQSKHIFDENL